MVKKKFIEKKQSATYRLVFKESSSAAGVSGEGTDRVFVRLDGGDSHVPGFDPDTEDDESQQEEHSGGAGRGSDNLRQEMLELGFPDDGYNYLQHLREVGASGRIGSFVPNNRVRLDLLRPDVKAFDASKVRVPSLNEESESNALSASGGARRIRGTVSKVVDSDVVALLDQEDDASLVSGDELEDDFVALANEGADAFSSGPGKDYRPSKRNSEHWDIEDKTEGDDDEDEDEDDDDDEDQHERPTRFLDEQFELLALREYDDDDIGELDDDDLSARGPANISKFNNVMSDFLINSTFTQDKYATPAESGRVDSSGGFEVTQSDKTAKESCSLFMPGVDKGSILASSAMLDESVSADEEKELVLESDSDSDEGRWDCESIVTTYSTLDNHPGKIGSFPKASSKSTRQSEANQSVIRLRGKQQIPVDYLPKRGSVQGDGKSKSLDQGKTVNVVRRRAEETKEEKKVRKAAIKEEKRSARALKKDVKLMYKDESQRAQRTAAFTGPATVHLG